MAASSISGTRLGNMSVNPRDSICDHVPSEGLRCFDTRLAHGIEGIPSTQDEVAESCRCSVKEEARPTFFQDARKVSDGGCKDRSAARECFQYNGRKTFEGRRYYKYVCGRQKSRHLVMRHDAQETNGHVFWD